VLRYQHVHELRPWRNSMLRYRLLHSASFSSHPFVPRSFPCRLTAAVQNYTKITLSEFGTAWGDDQIMAEIYARGPVAANIDAVGPFPLPLSLTCLQDCLHYYTGGINMYDSCNKIVNHAISLSGWGTEVSGVHCFSSDRIVFSPGWCGLLDRS
jgi:hypothetical protein